MIKVTKAGKCGIHDKLMTGTCARCECEAECMTSDTQIGARGQEMEIVRFIRCPSCGTQLYVKEKE